MRELRLMLFTLFAFIGICFVVSMFTQNTAKDGKDRDHAFMTFMHGVRFLFLNF